MEIEPEELQRIVAQVPANVDGGLQGKEALGALEPLLLSAADWGNISQTYKAEWTPGMAGMLSHSLEDARVGELENGAEPNEEELELWESEYETLMEGAEAVYIHHLAPPANEAFWFTWVAEGSGQMTDDIEAAGPFRSLASLVQWLAPKVSEWYGWAAFLRGDAAQPIAAMLEAATTNRDPSFADA